MNEYVPIILVALLVSVFLLGFSMGGNTERSWLRGRTLRAAVRDWYERRMTALFPPAPPLTEQDAVDLERANRTTNGNRNDH